ncbi:hypothetical protein SAMN04487897_11925 [Paenibacillus sp. yr247]|nr:hypothetical protein SAMN04487897_11925 [Paenibacillus sp. yr247]
MNLTEQDWTAEEQRVQEVAAKMYTKIIELEDQVGQVHSDVVEIRKHYWDEVTRVIKTGDRGSLHSLLAAEVTRLLGEGYASIAIIARTASESKLAHQALEPSCKCHWDSSLNTARPSSRACSSSLRISRREWSSTPYLSMTVPIISTGMKMTASCSTPLAQGLCMSYVFSR